MLPMLLMMQSALSTPPLVPEAPPAVVDQRPVVVAKCAPTTDGEITVCGSKAQNETYRLRPLPDTYVVDRSARIKLAGGGSIAATGESGRLGDAQAKLTLKMPF